MGALLCLAYGVRPVWGAASAGLQLAIGGLIITACKHCDSPHMFMGLG
eukprot:gene48716-4826_t